jgi:hypothetical protein
MRRPRNIGILDAQDEMTFVMAGKQPVEETGPGSTYMKISGWTGSEPDSNHPL